MRGNARIHAILARDGATAVIFRRGPSKKTAVIGWNLKDDSFKVGQWFYGIDCRVSPTRLARGLCGLRECARGWGRN